jgi:hypothetical protein
VLGGTGLVVGGVGGGLWGATEGAATGAAIGGAGGAVFAGVGAAPGAAGGAVVGGVAGGVTGAGVGGAAGYGVGSTAGAWVDQTGVGQAVNQKVEDFQQWLYGDKAADKVQAKAGTQSITCATCAANPCAALACGAPVGEYRGGAHGCMTKPVNDKKDSHHMPADSISPLNREVSPSIQMDPRDHRRTNSYGQRPATNAVLAGQQDMIASGNFMGAQAIDVAEVMAKFPGKYDAAIAQMAAYTACLKQHGIIR